jgi:hypothetical protein
MPQRLSTGGPLNAPDVVRWMDDLVANVDRQLNCLHRWIAIGLGQVGTSRRQLVEVGCVPTPMTLARCSFSKITTTTWFGRGGTAPFFSPSLTPVHGTMVSEPRGSPHPGWPGARGVYRHPFAGLRVVAGMAADLRASAARTVAIPVGELKGTAGMPADCGSLAMQAENPISSVMATAQPDHRGKAGT